jgi:polyketide biosynthesis acyl carrier protein
VVPSQILETFRGVVLNVIPDVEPDAVTPDARLVDLGANSIDRADIIADILEALDVAIPFVEFVGRGTVGDILQLIRAHPVGDEVGS